MEQIAAGILLRGLYQTIVFTIDLEQVPTALRTCIELVRTCYTDWCDLVELRNEYLPLLERQPKILDRMNNIITNAHISLQEVCVLVEKCRPVGGKSRTPLIRRLEWVLLDSTLFKQYEPVISRHHSSVLAELNFLRNLAFSSGTMGTQQEADEGSDGDDKKATKLRPTFENVDILGDIMGRSSNSTSSRGPTLGQSIAQLGAAVASGPIPPPPPPSYTASWELHQSAPTIESTAGVFQNTSAGNWSGSIGSAGGQGRGLTPLGRPTSYTPVSSASGAWKKEIFLSNERLQALGLAHPSPVTRRPSDAALQTTSNTTPQSQSDPSCAYSMTNGCGVEPADYRRLSSVDVGASSHNTSLSSNVQRRSGESWQNSYPLYTPTRSHVAEPSVPTPPKWEPSPRSPDAGTDTRRVSLGFSEMKVTGPAYRKPLPSSPHLIHMPSYTSLATATPSIMNDSSSSLSQPSTISKSPVAWQAATPANSSQRPPWHPPNHNQHGLGALSDGGCSQGNFHHMVAQPAHTRNDSVSSERRITQGNIRYSQPESELLKQYPFLEGAREPAVARLAAHATQPAQRELGYKEAVSSQKGVERSVSVVAPAYLHHMHSPWDPPSLPAPHPPHPERPRSTDEGRTPGNYQGSIAELPTVNHMRFEVWEKE